MRNFLVFLVAFIATVGCEPYASGNEKLDNASPQTVGVNVTVGVTTREQVRALYGNPDSMSPTQSNGEIWRYNSTYFGGPKTDLPFLRYIPTGTTEKNTVIFVFNRKDVLESYYVEPARN